MNRRLFFGRIAKVAAAIAVAPAAVAAALKAVPKPAFVPFWFESRRATSCYSDDYLQALYALAKARGPEDQIDIFTDRATADRLRGVFTNFYDKKRSGLTYG